MSLKIGDHVVHPACGIGHIVKIEEKQFSKKSAARLYYQVAMPNHNTIWTPVVPQTVSRLRLMTAGSDLDQYRTLLKSRPFLLEKKDDHQQHLKLVNRLKQGSFKVTCQVVRDLTVAGWQKPLGVTAKTILRKTQQRLYQEWAMAADISITEATKEIDSLLLDSRQLS